MSKGHELMVNEKKGFVVYSFEALRKNGEEISQFKKRFSEFSKLNNSLKSRYFVPFQ